MAPAPQLDDANDTEITLGMGKMLILFFGLVILCAVFFGMGFTMGKNSVKSAPELLASPSAPARSATANKPTGTPGPAPESKPAEPAQQPTSGASQSTPSHSSGAEEPSGAPPLPPSGQGYFVQVAAVSKQEDAEALVEALKARQYPAFIANQPSDKLFHVQVGPFNDIKDAESMRTKLVSDGYNPILKK